MTPAISQIRIQDFSTDADMSGKDVIDICRTRFQVEFYFRYGKQHTGLTQCQSTGINKLGFNFNALLVSINLAKAASKKLEMPFSILTCKSVVRNAYMHERFICVSGILFYSRPRPRNLLNF